MNNMEPQFTSGKTEFNAGTSKPQMELFGEPENERTFDFVNDYTSKQKMELVRIILEKTRNNDPLTEEETAYKKYSDNLNEPTGRYS